MFILILIEYGHGLYRIPTLCSSPLPFTLLAILMLLWEASWMANQVPAADPSDTIASKWQHHVVAYPEEFMRMSPITEGLRAACFFVFSGSQRTAKRIGHIHMHTHIQDTPMGDY